MRFWDNCQFPGVIGVVNGVHIAIWPPETIREHLYLNRKLYHSLNVMLILAVNAGHGGRTHDSRVWNASEVSVHLEEQHRNGRTGTWLLGDSGYPLLPYLMIPKLNQIPGSPSAAYINAHVKARCSVERCIGVLKGRWRCLRKVRALHYKPEFAALIVNAGCVLHNVAKWYNITDPEPYFDDIDLEVHDANGIDAMDVPNRRTGNEVRENIIRRFFM
ncbi:putative nuclease HARBI1 [Temnothorax nylanderi]|uniref:putative nuclease HARBI1 n=2 Tax=Temnothorax nylanderi TaxID=102681 RepID=UPI003A86BFF6